MRVPPMRLVSLLMLLAPGAIAQAHPVPIARASLQIDSAARRFELCLDCDVTALVLGTSPGDLSPQAAARLAAMADDQLAHEVERTRSRFIDHLEIRANRAAVLASDVLFPPVAAVRSVNETPSGSYETRQARITVRGTLSDPTASLSIRFPREIGAVLLTARRNATDLDPQLLPAGDESAPLSRGPSASGTDAPGAIPASVIVAGQFLGLGFWHIVPTGPDHVLFVLGLFLLSPLLRPLLWQVTAFTLAHSITLALAMLGLFRLPAEIVEPLIALSIAFVAIENLFTAELHPWRPVVVFAFGLLHGLGFAGVMLELPLRDGHFAPALVGFNLGVEVGQLTVIGAAFLAVGWLRHSPRYRRYVVVPGSLAIAAMGIYWTLERTLP